jgi:glycosyltransferase involved in cell wall biosynthesis
MVDRVLRVGVDAWNLPHDRRGIGRYVRALLAEFAGPLADRIELTLIVPEWPSLPHRGRYRAAAGGLDVRVHSRRSAARANLDLLWFPFNGMSWSPPRSIPAVATLHDASMFVLPGFDDAARAPFRTAAMHARRIITDSAFCAAELARELDIAPDRIDPILLGVATPAPAPLGRANAYVSATPFVLFVGEAEPRKGLPDLAAAVALLQADGIDVALNVIGRIPDGTELPAGAHMLGHVDDAQLAELYRACAVFAYPSHYEGFGLPVLEAMSYGAPVVASDAAGIPEAGGDAARYFASGDVNALAEALRAVLLDDITAEDLRIRGHARAATMTWRATAEHTLAAFHRALQ